MNTICSNVHEILNKRSNFQWQQHCARSVTGQTLVIDGSGLQWCNIRGHRAAGSSLLCVASCCICSVDKWQVMHFHPFRHYTIVKVTRSPMPATLSSHSNGISFWLDCYKSDWQTTDWSTQRLFGWFGKLAAIEGDAGPQGKWKKGTEFVRRFFSKDPGVKRTRN